MHKEVVNTEKVNLQMLVESSYRLLVPSYQREYAWREEQYAKLFQDLKNSFQHHDDSIEKESTYFLGSILTRKNNTSLELIDGQQRNTCLMLLALAFKRMGISSSLLQYPNHDGEFRIKFPIRDSVQDYLNGKLTSSDDDEKWKDAYKDKNNSIERDPRWFLSQTLAYFTSKLKELKENDNPRNGEGDSDKELWSKNKLRRFGDFIYERVFLVNNEVPANADMEGLFATMNNTGVQLEKQDILKALLLEKIKDEKERKLYNSIWMSCENMDNYFERNLNEIFSKEPYRVSFKLLKKDDLRSFSRFKHHMKDGDVTLDDKNFKGFDEIKSEFEGKIDSLYLKKIKEEKGEKNYSDEDLGAEYCSSIVPFPLLLLHTFRIYQLHNSSLLGASRDIRFHTDNLLKFFEVMTSDISSNAEVTVKEFIQCLWKVRFEFDCWVVKWVSLEGEQDRKLMLQKLRNPSGSSVFSRDSEESKTSLTMLQSMRYFVSEHITQFWLTPLLGWLISCDKIPQENVILEKLENIDDALSLANIYQGDAAFILLERVLSSEEVVTFSSKQSYLNNESNGTSFKHYWFQKLEYVLWKKRQIENRLDKRFSQYRILSRNSVEHVYPQNGHKNTSGNGKNIKLDEDCLHDFGNLALLNVSQNSSYSDNYVSVKMAMFKSDTGAYISLKLKSLFDLLEKNNWNIEKGLDLYRESLKEHKEEMLSELEQHYNDSRRV